MVIASSFYTFQIYILSTFKYHINIHIYKKKDFPVFKIFNIFEINFQDFQKFFFPNNVQSNLNCFICSNYWKIFEKKTQTLITRCELLRILKGFTFFAVHIQKCSILFCTHKSQIHLILFN